MCLDGCPRFSACFWFVAVRHRMTSLKQLIPYNPVLPDLFLPSCCISALITSPSMRGTAYASRVGIMPSEQECSLIKARRQFCGTHHLVGNAGECKTCAIKAEIRHARNARRRSCLCVECRHCQRTHFQPPQDRVTLTSTLVDHRRAINGKLPELSNKEQFSG